MRKRLSIKVRITLWYAALIVFLCASAILSLFAIADHAQNEHCRQTLESAAVIIMDEMEIEHGLMEIDAEIDDVPGVYAALFDLRGELIYGRNRAELPFEEGNMRQAQDREHRYMVRDTLLSVPNMEPVWLRVYMTADLTASAAWAVLDRGFWLLPLLSLLALGGGYRITAHAFKPVGRMSRLAASIADGGDLSARVGAGTADDRDELHMLAQTLDGMLGRLENAFERERQFTSDVAHELRTPLNAMQTQGEYALGCEMGEEKDQAIVRMLDKNEEMRMLVSQLLMIARLDAGSMEMKDDVELAPMIQEIAEDLQPVAEQKGISVQTALCGIQLRGNRSILARAIINLTDNAIRYGRENGNVWISLKKENEEAVILVEDDGCGMSAEALDHVFERFWRGDDARSTPGTGIGMAIARAAARAHGGDISVKSVLGEGSCFTIRIPLKK